MARTLSGRHTPASAKELELPGGKAIRVGPSQVLSLGLLPTEQGGTGTPMGRVGVEPCHGHHHLHIVGLVPLYLEGKLSFSISSPVGPTERRLPAGFRIDSQWGSLASKAAWMATQGREQ